MKNDRLAKKSVIDKRKKAILAMALAKERKRNMRKQLELAYEGNRVVNLKTLKEQMQCQTCHAVLDLILKRKHDKDFFRNGKFCVLIVRF